MIRDGSEDILKRSIGSGGTQAASTAFQISAPTASTISRARHIVHAIALCSVLVARGTQTVLAQNVHEFDGTLVQHEHGSAIVIDLQCHYHTYAAPVGIIVDGTLSKSYLRPPIAAHFVIGPSTAGETIISLTRRATGAPRNCSV